MAKVLHQGRWFEEVASAATYESAFERQVAMQAALLWPQFHAVPFKCPVYSEEGSAKADYALVERQYREWWVVEVEMAHHPLHSHVIPQVRILSRAAYGSTEATRLCEADPTLHMGRATDMMKGRQPKVLVVVNKPSPDWVLPLAKFDASLAIFEVFRSDKNDYLFRVNGEYPVGPSETVTACRYDPVIPRWLVVESPAGLGIQAGKRLTILYQQTLTEWDRVDVSDKVWLSPPGPNPLPYESDYEIVRRGDGQLAFREVLRKGG